MAGIGGIRKSSVPEQTNADSGGCKYAGRTQAESAGKIKLAETADSLAYFSGHCLTPADT